ncbi:Formiminotetrahydrofolate cyclodeaminase [Desulfacinum infernum DSM 9756]|uniref:Formiminotetrahydrofolate cyclodeaminase n=1 Tax=Desulfacinum infernum DSM 9756 TaxID=1121391 RepID=A0A1M5DMF0_9BACT|nr:cyclodeaminase/cyclohydrolase family protein [Desulfacinum infernum]SHF68153.1 Formiminotetrahydrofolate cyclodeaminase [Desulfacinum infernum DSM 9756]
MKNLNQLTVTEFLEELASENPVPGGGSVAALAGALAAALTTMVARLTVGREKFQDRWETMEPIEKRAAERIALFQSLVQKDTEAYQKVVDAFRLPKETEEEKRSRREAVQEAFKEAARVPLETLLALKQLAEDALEAVRSGNPNAASDAGAAVQMIRAGATVAAYNVWINLGSIKDEAFCSEAKEKADAALARIRKAESQCHDLLAKELL